MIQVSVPYRILLDQSHLQILGPLIKTDLFPHQRKALTFFLTREQDSSCLKQCKKTAKKALRKKRGHTADAEAEEEKTKEKEKKKDEEDGGNSLWEPVKDDKGKIRSWKNKITGKDLRGKKGKPAESKGALLADDVRRVFIIFFGANWPF